MSNPRQYRFSDEGNIEPSEDDTNKQRLGDDGLELESYQTKGRFNQYEMRSLAMKSCRRGDREKVIFAIFELARSGFEVWGLLEQIMLEDCRLSVEEAYIVSAINRLKQLSQNRWSPHEGMGLACAMRAASILAEAESSHELLFIKNHWNDVANDRLEALKNGEEPEMDFPVEPDLSDVEYAVRDTHTYAGSAKGRDFGHYLVEASRTTELTELERAAKQKRMEYREEKYGFTPAEYERALTPIDPNEPWGGGEDLKHHRLDELEE